jgi:transcriptional regulator with GAF, ATPase, and Fis domain
MAEEHRDVVRQAVGSAGQGPEPGVARQLSELARALQADNTVEELLNHIAKAAVTEVPGAQYAGITQVSGQKFTTTAASDKLIDELDQLQYQAGEGPCLDAARHHETVRCDDLRTDDRWPRFARQATDLGVLSVLSLQLFVGGDSLGALNLYAAGAAAFGAESESTGILLASHAALALASASVQTNLLAAMDSRDVIGEAKGILMERYKIPRVEAFGLLVASSQAMNRKLRDVAEHLVATGELLTPVR